MSESFSKLRLRRGPQTQTHFILIVLSQPFDIPVYDATSHGKTWIIASKLGGTEWILMDPASTNAV